MAYSSEVLSRAMARLASAREDHESLSAARRARVYTQVPRIREIDRQMQLNMVKAAYAAFSEEGAGAMEQAKNANQALQRERDALMTQHFEPGYWNDGPYCGVCGGSGYLGSHMCDCLKKFCVEEQRRELGAIFAGSASFESFRLDYYDTRILPGVGFSAREVMEKNLKAAKEYARTFTGQAGNLLFNGSTGLGKTHLALSIGRVVGDMGYSVSYESAVSLFSKLEQAKFSPTDENRLAAEKLEKCDLLILDDLGTEMPGQFVTAALYGLLNVRLMAGRPMIITTNLNVDEAGKRYSPQIASRLYGDFVRLTFLGDDIRRLKNIGI